jgi:flavodoxin
MKGVVAYDTYYGNTKLVAEAIVEQIKADGHEAELMSVREPPSSGPHGDFMLIGSPVRIARVTRRTRKFVKKLDVAAWKDKPIAAFVTVGPMKENPTEKEKADAQKWSVTPGSEFRDMIKARGLMAYDQVLYVEVKDIKGPLVDTGIEKARQFVHAFLQTLKK